MTESFYCPNVVGVFTGVPNNKCTYVVSTGVPNNKCVRTDGTRDDENEKKPNNVSWCDAVTTNNVLWSYGCDLDTKTRTNERRRFSWVFVSSIASYAEEKNTTIVRTCECDIREYRPVRNEARFLTTLGRDTNIWIGRITHSSRIRALFTSRILPTSSKRFGSIYYSSPSSAGQPTPTNPSGCSSSSPSCLATHLSETRRGGKKTNPAVLLL